MCMHPTGVLVREEHVHLQNDGIANKLEVDGADLIEVLASNDGTALLIHFST